MTEKTQPTDAEIDALWALLTRAVIASPTKFAREVLAKWGQPAHSGAADLRDTLIDIAREIEALKRECGMDPESPIAIQNGRYMALSYKVRALAAGQATAAQQPGAAGLIDALEDAQRAINSMKVEAETAAQGDEQMMLEACETISNEGLQADMAIRAALASHGQAPAQPGEPAKIDLRKLQLQGIVLALARLSCVPPVAPALMHQLERLIDFYFENGDEDFARKLVLLKNGAFSDGRRSALVHSASEAPQPVTAYAELPTHSHTGRVYEEGFLIGTSPLYTADQMRAFADATHALRASHGQAPAQDANEYLDLLAQCRSAFPIPERGDPLEVHWAAAMADPGEVPGYLQEIAARHAAKAAPAAVAGPLPAPTDPMDWPLPCDLTAGSVTICKGCTLRTVQVRLQVQSETNALLMRKLSQQPSPAAQGDALDAARLDWLIEQDNCVVFEGVNGFCLCWIDEHDPQQSEYQTGTFPTARAAIDAARAAQMAAEAISAAAPQPVPAAQEGKKP